MLVTQQPFSGTALVTDSVDIFSSYFHRLEAIKHKDNAAQHTWATGLLLYWCVTHTKKNVYKIKKRWDLMASVGILMTWCQRFTFYDNKKNNNNWKGELKDVWALTLWDTSCCLSNFYTFNQLVDVTVYCLITFKV